jgi:hypothetical protein
LRDQQVRSRGGERPSDSLPHSLPRPRHERASAR